MRIPLIFGVLALTALVFYTAIQSLPTANNSPATASAIAEIEASRAAFEDQAAVLNTTIAALEAENLNQVALMEATVATRDALHSQLDETVQRLITLEAEVVASSTANVELTEEIATLKNEIDSRQNAANTQALNEAIEASRAEVETLQAKISDLEQERVNMTAQLAERDANVVATPAPGSELAPTETVSDDTAARLAEAEERIARLTQIATVQVQVATDLTDEIEGFEAQVATLTSEASDMSDEITKRDAVIAGLLARTASPAQSLLASCQERTEAALAASQIVFEANTTTIAPASIPLLTVLAAIVIECVQDDLTLEIEGHTSDVGDAANNLLLSDGRAKAIREFMVESGVPASALRAVGFGGSDPIADNATSEGQSQNQRVVFDWEHS